MQVCSLAGNLLRDALFRGCSRSDHAHAVLLATFPSDRTPVVAATACLVPFLLDPAAALGRHPPWCIKLKCLALVEAFLLGVSSAACARLPPSASVLVNLHLPARSSAHSWLLRLRFGSVSAPALLHTPAPVLHMSAPVCRGTVADDHLPRLVLSRSCSTAAAAQGRMSPWYMKFQCLDFVAAFLLGTSSAVCTRQPPTASMLARFRLPGPPSMRGCSAYGPRPGLPRSACLRLILFCTCPPLCAGALWPMPAWVWCDVRSDFFFP